LQKGNAIPKGRGDHSALEDDIEERLIEWVKKNFQNRAAVNWTGFSYD
jgi:hypothetical protein